MQLVISQQFARINQRLLERKRVISQAKAKMKSHSHGPRLAALAHSLRSGSTDFRFASAWKTRFKQAIPKEKIKMPSRLYRVRFSQHAMHLVETILTNLLT